MNCGKTSWKRQSLRIGKGLDLGQGLQEGGLERGVPVHSGPSGLPGSVCMVDNT